MPHGNPDQMSPYKKKIPKIRSLTRIFPTRKDPLRQKLMLTLHYYKNPKTLTNQSMHNLLQF